MSMTVPDGWTLYSEISEAVPPVSADGPRHVNHTKRWARDAQQPRQARIALEGFEGPLEPQTLDSVRGSEAAPVVWETSRAEEVILARQDAQAFGLTIASWDQSPTLRVSVIASGDVTLEQVKAAVESAVVRPE